MSTPDFKILLALAGLTVAHVITALSGAPAILLWSTTAGLLGALAWTGWSIWQRVHSVETHEQTLRQNQTLLDLSAAMPGALGNTDLFPPPRRSRFSRKPRRSECGLVIPNKRRVTPHGLFSGGNLAESLFRRAQVTACDLVGP